jgi:hypothetical protein
MHRTLALFALVLLACGLGFAQKTPCMQAFDEADTIRTWDGLYRSYGLYRSCDDGAVGEGYSESVARILADHWGTLPRLADLGKKDGRFRQFVLRHVDASLDMKDIEEIKTRARTQCPRRLGTLCHELANEADAALKEAASWQ